LQCLLHPDVWLAGLGHFGHWLAAPGLALASTPLAIDVEQFKEMQGMFGEIKDNLPGIKNLSATCKSLQDENSRLQQQVGDAWVATAVNGIVGTIVLLVGYGLVAVFGHPGPHEWPGQWWLYLGGTIGVVVIFATVLAVRVLGVFRLVLALIAGQLAAAVVIDLVVPAQHGVVTPTVMVGVLLTFVAVSVAGRVPRVRPAEVPGTLEP